MCAQLVEIVNSISRAASTLVEFDTFACLTSAPEPQGTPQRRVEQDCRDLCDAANELAQMFTDDRQLRSQPQLPTQLDGGVRKLSKGMETLAHYWQNTEDEIERASELVNAGYSAIDQVLRTVVEIAAAPVTIFLPKHDRMHRQRALLLASLAERFTERLAAHASH